MTVCHQLQDWKMEAEIRNQFSSVAQSCVTLFNPMDCMQHVKLPCPSPTPVACSNSCPSSWWCHLTISSSVIPFSSCLQSFAASGAFQMSQLFASGSQNIGASGGKPQVFSPGLSPGWNAVFPWGLEMSLIHKNCVFLPSTFHLFCCFWSIWGRRINQNAQHVHL